MFQIRYASPERLFERLTDLRFLSIDFLNTFLLTYRVFTDGVTVLEALKKVHYNPESQLHTLDQPGGIESLDDAPRPGAPVKASDDATTWAIDEMIANDRHISNRVISAKLNLSYGSVQKSLQNFLQRYEIESEGFLDRIVTRDESWIHHHIPDFKRSSPEWHHKGLSTPKKPRITASAGKVLLTIFGTRGLLSKGFCLQHDNAWPHVAKFTIEIINKLKIEVLINPPHSPDLASNEY
ncbi:RASGRF1 [Cordylochernes scorpioides]|uniref:RASGRF1 n=1 Tax=Cordylochernes scorpioides TaxID=51811 RepID=A0ABY6L6S5_9ARAC|nr:RASGRF1 [Cordylochernes scorpioides]